MKKALGVLCVLAFLAVAAYAADSSSAVGQTGSIDTMPCPVDSTAAAAVQSTASAAKPAVGSTSAEAPSPFKTLKEKFSYSVGYGMGQTMKHDKVDADIDLMAKGMKDAVAGATPVLTQAQMQDTMIQFQKEFETRRAAEAKEAAATNQKLEETFLADNAKKPGVKVLPSGLQYIVVKEGTGPKPKVSDTVSVNYVGTFIDGKEFDNSYKRGAPATFEIGQVIPGWTEALQQINVGSKWKIFIPSKLAYGAAGQGEAIPPSSTLIFEVDLLAICPPAAPVQGGTIDLKDRVLNK